jgi:hypothetical protein
MPACVLDASSVFPWLFEDEASPQADALLDLIIQQGAAYAVAKSHRRTLLFKGDDFSKTDIVPGGGR